MNINELNGTARDLLAVRAMIAELEAEAEALTDRIKGAMIAAGTETLDGDGWRATWKNVNSRRFDGKAFRADNPELASQYMKQTTTTRFLIAYPTMPRVSVPPFAGALFSWPPGGYTVKLSRHGDTDARPTHTISSRNAAIVVQ